MIPAVVSLSRSPLCSSCRQSFTRRGLATSFLLIRAKRVGAARDTSEEDRTDRPSAYGITYDRTVLGVLGLPSFPSPVTLPSPRRFSCHVGRSLVTLVSSRHERAPRGGTGRGEGMTRERDRSASAPREPPHRGPVRHLRSGPGLRRVLVTELNEDTSSEVNR